jgi:hypothetical protein
MLGDVPNARTIDGTSRGKIAKRDAHRFDAILHRQQPLHVIVGDDDGHGHTFPGIAPKAAEVATIIRSLGHPLASTSCPQTFVKRMARLRVTIIVQDRDML